MEKLRFYDFMRAGHVKRWHIVNTVRDQTVAEHQYLVTVIAMELFSKLGQYWQADADQMESDNNMWLGLIAGALFSDTPEVRYGDFPSPAKKYIKAIGGEDLFAKLDRELIPHLPYVGGDVNDGLARIIKMADFIEATHWIMENKAGIHSEAVAKSNARAMAEAVVRFTQETATDWFGPVNEILIELGMPYISKSMLVTPP